LSPFNLGLNFSPGKQGSMKKNEKGVYIRVRKEDARSTEHCENIKIKGPPSTSLLMELVSVEGRGYGLR
jgi:hypothetical protein